MTTFLKPGRDHAPRRWVRLRLAWRLGTAAQQPLLPTLGCVRIHNADLRDKVLPLYRQGTVYLGMFQEKK